MTMTGVTEAGSEALGIRARQRGTHAAAGCEFFATLCPELQDLLPEPSVRMLLVHSLNGVCGEQPELAVRCGGGSQVPDHVRVVEIKRVEPKDVSVFELDEFLARIHLPTRAVGVDVLIEPILQPEGLQADFRGFTVNTLVDQESLAGNVARTEENLVAADRKLHEHPRQLHKDLLRHLAEALDAAQLLDVQEVQHPHVDCRRQLLQELVHVEVPLLLEGAVLKREHLLLQSRRYSLRAHILAHVSDALDVLVLHERTVGDGLADRADDKGIYEHRETKNAHIDDHLFDRRRASVSRTL